MKKLLITILFTLILSGNTFAEQYRVAVSGYYDETKSTLNGKSKVSLEAAKDEALRLCKNSNLMSKGKPESCLVYRIVIHKDGLFGKLIKDEIVWSKEVAKFEKKLEQKKIAEKPKKNKPVDEIEKVIIKLNNCTNKKVFKNVIDRDFIIDTEKKTIEDKVRTSNSGSFSNVRKISSIDNNTIISEFYQTKFKEYKWKLKINIEFAEVKNSRYRAFDNKFQEDSPPYFCESKNIIAKKIQGEPKKEEPKKQTPNPDDNKIVAASSGTGFYVSNTGHIISNHHVVEGCNTVKLTFKGKEVSADVLAVDKMNDLAILKADITPSKVYSVATEDASLLEDIIIAGYPLGKKVSAAIKTSKGSITALAGYGDNYSEFQTDAALNQGNSGGPIMNQKGNVVGVAVANYGKNAGVESFNFGIKSSTLKTFANANGLTFLPPNNKDLSNKDLGQLITEATIYLECHMTVAKIKRMIAEAENKKAFFSEYR